MSRQGIGVRAKKSGGISALDLDALIDLCESSLKLKDNEQVLNPPVSTTRKESYTTYDYICDYMNSVSFYGRVKKGSLVVAKYLMALFS